MGNHCTLLVYTVMNVKYIYIRIDYVVVTKNFASMNSRNVQRYFCELFKNSLASGEQVRNAYMCRGITCRWMFVVHALGIFHSQEGGRHHFICWTHSNNCCPLEIVPAGQFYLSSGWFSFFEPTQTTYIPDKSSPGWVWASNQTSVLWVFGRCY